jgi:aryl sulfotransferase
MTGLDLIASYQKSGNTWVRALLTALGAGGGSVDINALEGPITANRAFFDDALEIETSDLLDQEQFRLQPSAYRVAKPPRARAFPMKIHDAWLPAPGAAEPPLPKERIGAVVLIVRDPRDVAPSLAAHRGLSIDEAIAFMADPGIVLASTRNGLRTQLPQFMSSWSAHTMSWLGSGLRLTVVRYEDMIADPLRAFATITSAFDRSASTEQLAAAVEAARFEALQAQEARQGFREASRHNPRRFFGSGKAGGWRLKLTAAQADRIWQDHGAVMRELGYDG